MDGWIVIGTDVDTKEFDKELKRLKRDAEKFANEEERLLNKKAKLELDTSKTMNELSKVDKKIETITQKMKVMESNNIPENLKGNDNYQNLVNQSEILNAKSEEYLTKLNLQKGSLSDINTKLIENSTHQTDINSKIQEMESKTTGLHMNFDNIGKSIMDNVKKVGKWALAVFSIRTAYNAVRQAMSVISTYNDDLNNKLYSIKMMFASALEPIVTRLVNLVWKLMSYINYIAKAWFGIDLMAKASTNSLKSSNKQAKELKKTLTGIDEATVLNDNGTTGAIGASMPKFEMPEDVEPPKWVKWIADNKELIESFGKVLLAVFGASFISKILGNIGLLFGKSGGLGLIGLKEILAIIGTAYLVSIAVKGVTEAVDQFKKLKTEIDQNTSTMENHKNKSEELAQKFQTLHQQGKLTSEQLDTYRQYLDNSTDSSISLIKQLEGQKNWFTNLTGTTKDLNEQQRIQSDEIKNTMNNYKYLYEQGLLNEEQQKRYKEKLEKVIEALSNQGQDVRDLQIDYKNLTGEEYVIKTKIEADTSDAEKDYSNWLTKLGEKIGSFFTKTSKKFNNLIKEMAAIGGNGGGGKSGGGFAKGGIVSYGNVYGFSKGGIAYPKLQYCASGAIINQPGRGVPITQAIGGERGQEGILPLTDSQQMDLLGSAIARHMNFNATIPIYMGNRQIAREIVKIIAQQDYAANR